jgi:RNA polymerase sigma-70 factor (ECF subfamily)
MAIQSGKEGSLERSDGDLVRAVLGGDRGAYAALYDRYAPVVRAICDDRTRDLAQAQDLSQEIFLKAYRKLAGLRDPERFAAWLVGIARNECRDWLRGKLRDRHDYTDRVPDVPASGDDGQDSDARAAMETMRLLPERERLALHAFYLQGESAEAIQGLLGLSVSGTYRLINRARERLATLLHRMREEVP